MIGDAKRVLQMAARLVERIERRVERLHRGFDQGRRLGAAALEPPHRRRQRRHRRVCSRHRVVRVAKVARDLLGLHHRRAALGQRRFLARLGLELAQFLDGVTEPIGLAPRPLDLGAMLGNGLLGLAPRAP